MFLVFEIFWAALGVGTLITGRLSVFGHWIVEGVAARLIGVLLVAPVIVPGVLGGIRGWENAQKGIPFNYEDYTDLGVLELSMWAGCFATAAIISVIAARRPGKQVNPEEEWKQLRMSGQLDEGGYGENPLRRR